MPRSDLRTEFDSERIGLRNTRDTGKKRREARAANTSGQGVPQILKSASSRLGTLLAVGLACLSTPALAQSGEVRIGTLVEDLDARSRGGDGPVVGEPHEADAGAARLHGHLVGDPLVEGGPARVGLQRPGRREASL